MFTSSTIFSNLPPLSAKAFNGLAGEQNLPFLITDKLGDPSQLSPEHLEFIDPRQQEVFVCDGQFTREFEAAYRQLVELKRRRSVARSLAEARTVVIQRDMSHLLAPEKEMIAHLLIVARKVEELFMKQQGSFPFISEIEARKEIDPQSHKLFWRNQGPWALGPKSQDDPHANALPTFNKQRVAIYPADVELTADFFAAIEKDKDLSHQWTVVIRDQDGSLKAVPYHEYYKPEMQEIADELDASARAIESVTEEQAIHKYLKAAAAAFQGGNWDVADEKWVAMNMGNSKYALRVAPDETYWDPGNLKAGFEFWLGLIDTDAAQFSQKLNPLIQDMENHLQELVAAYTPREIKAELPDFIEVIFRAGDHRIDIGAAVGQQLPNFNDKHSRMVVMTNYGTDEKSTEIAKERAFLMLVEEQAKVYEPKKHISTTGTLLHEMTHSFGVQGANFEVRKPDSSIKLDEDNLPITTKKALGGHNSQVMEELKAQTGGLYWVGWLKDKGIITAEMASDLYTDAIMWAFGHISVGMWAADGSPKTYSQLAGIQIRHFLGTGALSIEENKFRIHYDKMHASLQDLFKTVVEIQVYGDADKAQELRLDVGKGEGYDVIQGKRIQELYATYPRASFDLQIQGID